MNNNSEQTLKPNDCSDVGEAKVFAEQYADCLRYTEQTGYLYYDGSRWIARKLYAQKCAQDLTEKQLAEVAVEIDRIMRDRANTGALNMLLKEAHSVQKFYLRCRDSHRIAAVLKEAEPLLAIKIEQLDADGFLLNTPAGTIDLRVGLASMREHTPEDYCTKITAVSPGDEGADVWQHFLMTICCGDDELITYLQQVCGLAAIGRVYVEALVIAVGDGRNGKSTFFNVISHTLGDYAGNLSANVLTKECRNTTAKAELAELRGKRLVIASELGSDAHLSDAVVKQLCSTDQIVAERKYRDPFAFTPSHTAILYTNHLPMVTANDDGIWRRLIVVPFNARIEGDADVKNYADYLFNHAGPAILAWIINGAKMVIDNKYRLLLPQCVTEAISEYRHDNDWFAQFLQECCEVGEGKEVSSSVLYRTYRGYCMEQGETAKSTTSFYGTLKNAGFKKLIRSGRSYIVGLALRSD